MSDAGPQPFDALYERIIEARIQFDTELTRTFKADPGADPRTATRYWANRLLEITEPDTHAPELRTMQQLLEKYEGLDEPIIDGLLRRGEIGNLVAGPKTGKSWLVLDLAVCLATGQRWLGRDCTKSRVLIIDNELKPRTLTSRLRRILQARDVSAEDIEDRLVLESLRGHLRPFSDMERYWDEIEPWGFDVIVFDALYKFLGGGESENDSGVWLRWYNEADRIADQLGATLIAIHHSSKGLQSERAVTDVGSGSSVQSRAADCHMILRAHEENGNDGRKVQVFEAVARSFPPPDALCLEYEHPVWEVRDDLDPADLLTAGKAAEERQTPETREAAGTLRGLVAQVFTDPAEWLTREQCIDRIRDLSLPVKATQARLMEALELGLTERAQDGRRGMFRPADVFRNGNGV